MVFKCDLCSVRLSEGENPPSVLGKRCNTCGEGTIVRKGEHKRVRSPPPTLRYEDERELGRVRDRMNVIEQRQRDLDAERAELKVYARRILRAYLRRDDA